MKKYIAVGSVGHFMPGDKIEGLGADRIQALLNCGAIKEVVPEAEAKTQPDPQVAVLEKQVAELKDEVAALKKAAADAEKKAKAEAKTDK